MSEISRRLQNLNYKEPDAVKVPKEIWNAIVDMIFKAENMDMRLVDKHTSKGSYFEYHVDGDGGDNFISTLAVLDDLSWQYEED